MSEREPDVSDDPRQQETGEGYPEAGGGGQSPTEGTDKGPEAGDEKHNEPGGSHGGQDDTPGAATGNPGAAGG